LDRIKEETSAESIEDGTPEPHESQGRKDSGAYALSREQASSLEVAPRKRRGLFPYQETEGRDLSKRGGIRRGPREGFKSDDKVGQKKAGEALAGVKGKTQRHS